MQFEVASDPLELVFQWWTDAFFVGAKQPPLGWGDIAVLFETVLLGCCRRSLESSTHSANLLMDCGQYASSGCVSGCVII